MSVVCPIQCVKSGCEDKDFLEKHSTFVMTALSLVGAGLTVLLTFCLKSRCSRVRCCGLSFERQPIPIDSINDVSLENASAQPTVLRQNATEDPA